MADIFGFNGTVGDYGFQDSTSGSAAFKFNDTLNLVQQWNVQYQLQIQPIFECGSSKVYFASKHANGTCQIGRIVAEKPIALTNNVGTVCKPGTGKITATSGCNGNSSVSLTLKSTVLSSVGFNGQAQNSYISEDVQVTFASLS